MKKVIFFICLQALMSCKHECKCDKPHVKEKSHEKKLEKATAFLEDEGILFIKAEGRPKNMLKYGKIVKLLREYDKTRKPVLRNALGFEDTRVNVYPLKELYEYLGYIDSICKKKKIKFEGINIISGAYSKKGDGSTPGYQTLIFMPSTTINGEHFVAFDPLRSKKGKPKTFKELLKKKGYHWGYDNSKIKREEGDIQKNKKSVSEDETQQDVESSGSNRLSTIPPYHGQ